MIEHPFLPAVDLSEMSLDELQTKMSELMSKLTWAGRMRNSAMIAQLNMLLVSYREAYRRKLDESLKNAGVSNTINIK